MPDLIPKQAGGPEVEASWEALTLRAMQSLVPADQKQWLMDGYNTGRLDHDDVTYWFYVLNLRSA